MDKIEEEIKVNNLHGLHVRPASIFVQIANKYDSSVKLVKNNEAVDGKSIMNILSLGINKGETIKLIIEGPDAKEVFRELKGFLEKENG